MPLRLLLLAVAAGTAVEAAPLTHHVPACAGIRVTAPSLATQPQNPSFSGRDVLDLQFQGRLLKDLQGDHLLHFKVHTPGGFLYQTLTVPFVGTAPRPTARERAAQVRLGAPPEPRSVRGYPRPLPVQRLVPVEGDAQTGTHYGVSTLLPVAGTSITLGGLYGRWTVQAYLDDGPEPCGPAGRFTIRN